jgi:RNA recognition motif-containing protein
MENKIVCRKCQGPHLTIKCGKESENKVEKMIKEEHTIQEKTIKIYRENRNNDDQTKRSHDTPPNRNYNQRSNNFNSENQDFTRRKYGKVKISNLPNNVSDEEMLELLQEHGHIIRLKAVNHEENSQVYIDFKTEDMADYFVKSLDKTPFEYQMLKVERLYD